MFSIGTVINGSYRILAILGTGGMGAVFKAFEEKRSREVALKFVYREIAEDQVGFKRFRQEGEILASIEHPNVVKVFSLETDSATGLPFLIMEYFAGIGLTDFLKELQQDPFWLVKTFLDLFDGVRAIHAKNIIHRDLKPDNVLVNSRGDLKIIDFGIAKAARRQTQTGVALGTSLYMSPEQCEGRPNITYKSDIYSLGICIWEVLTGKTPFYAPEESSDPYLAVIVKHLTAPLPMENLLGTHFGPLFADLLVRMLEKNPEKRPDIEFITDFLLNLREKHFAQGDSAFMRFSPEGPPQEGPFGTFRLFQDTSTGRPAMVHLVPAPARWPEEKIQERVHRLLRVRHFSASGILQKGFDKASNQHFMAMEPPGAIPFAKLKDSLIHDHGALLKFMLQILEGLKAIHDAGEFHGNLNPSHLGFTEEEDAKISGIPMIPVPLSEPKSNEAAWNYVAPELHGEGARGSAAADIFSAGVIFWELFFRELPPCPHAQTMTGKGKPAVSADETLTMKSVSTKDPLFPFLALLCRMINPEPSRRPLFNELLAMLRSLSGDSLLTHKKAKSKNRDRCLVMVNDKCIFSLLNATLMEFGFQGREAESLDDILALSATGPSIAWFIDLDGLQKSVVETMALAKKLAPDAKVVLLSRNITSTLVATCFQQQVTALLVKPLLIPRLVQVVSALSEEPELLEGENLVVRFDHPSAKHFTNEENRHNVLFFECGVCKERFGSMQPKPGSIEIRGTESDFCPICTSGNVPELYSVVVCPSCNYANFAGRFQKTSIAEPCVAEFLEPVHLEMRKKMALTLDFLGKRGFYEGVRSFELAAKGIQQLKPTEYHRFAGEFFLKASWLCRRFGKALEETEYQARALESLMMLYQPYVRLGYEFPGWNAIRKKLKPGQELLGERAVLVTCFLGAELSVRLGLNEQAEFYFDQIFELPFFTRFTLLARHITAAYREFKKMRDGKSPPRSPNFGTEISNPS
ncbi:MAG: DUF2225 domain-containing protein [Candidatus Ozemobacteraceae bacterium]